MTCIRLPAQPLCPGPQHGVPNPALRCATCALVANDVANVRARRQSISNMAGVAGANAQTLQGGWTQRAATILETMYDDYFNAHGGAAPCHFAFCWGGSGARKEACPYSDVDGFIVLENGATLADKAFFNGASTDVMKRLRQMLQVEHAHKGFTFCTGGLNPLAKTDTGVMIVAEGLTGTAVELAGVVERYLDSDNEFVQHLVAGLSDSSLAFGDPQLFADFKTEVDLVLGTTCGKMSWRPMLTYRRRMALEKIRDVSTNPSFAPPGPAATRFELKKQFYRVPQFLAQSLCWWHDIAGVTTDQQITALTAAGKISTTNAARLRMAMEAPLVLRVQSHLHANREQDWVRTNTEPSPNPDNELVLTDTQLFRLRRAAVVLAELRTLGQQFHAIKTKAFGHRRSPFYDH